MQMSIEDNMSNVTFTSQFLLMQFSDVRELQILHFFVFLALYLTAVTGNLLIIIVVAVDRHLHTPMYFFLTNLALMDIGTVSVTVPQSMANSLMNSRSISYLGCVAQVFFFFFFAASDLALLTVMAHDRYVAICNPLHYETIMHKGTCSQMAVCAYISSILYATLHTGGTFAITFCSNVVNQFFCEIPHLLTLSCNDLYLVETGFLVFACSIGAGCFIFIILTYTKIFATVLRIPSVHGQKKALSTCLPHIMAVSCVIIPGALAYAKPAPNPSTGLDILFAVMYAIIPPLVNPFIYSIRNKEIKSAMCKMLGFQHTSIKFS